MNAQLTKATTVTNGQTITLPANVGSRGTLLTFRGTSVGTVTVTGKVLGGDKFEEVTDGEIDLSVRKYIWIPEIPLEAVQLALAGLGGALDLYAYTV